MRHDEQSGLCCSASATEIQAEETFQPAVLAHHNYFDTTTHTKVTEKHDFIMTGRRKRHYIDTHKFVRMFNGRKANIDIHEQMDDIGIFTIINFSPIDRRRLNLLCASLEKESTNNTAIMREGRCGSILAFKNLSDVRRFFAQ